MGWTVADVMTKAVVVVGPDENFKACVRQLRRHHISAMPVVDANGRLVGIVSEDDLLAKQREREAKRPWLGLRWTDGGPARGRVAGDVMTSPVVSVSPAASVSEAARLMYRESVKRLPVVNAHGSVVGIVSRADLLKTFERTDESIRQEIVDRVLRRGLMVDPKTVEVEVVDGLVKLGGRLESKSLCELAVRMAERVEGTVDVESHLTWRLDDTGLRVEPPARALQLSADERK